MAINTGINVRASARSADFAQQLRENIESNRAAGDDPARGGIGQLARHIEMGGRETRRLRVTNTTNRSELAFEFKRFGYKSYRVERTAEMLKAFLEADGLTPDRAAAIVDDVLRDPKTGRYRAATGQDVLYIRDRAQEPQAGQFQMVVDTHQLMVRENTVIDADLESLHQEPMPNAPWPPNRDRINETLKGRGFVTDDAMLGAGSFGDVHRLTGPDGEALILKYLVKLEASDNTSPREIDPQELSFNRDRQMGPSEAMAAYLSRSSSQPDWQQTRAMVTPSHYIVKAPNSQALEVIPVGELKARVRSHGPLQCVAEVAPAVNGKELFEDLKGADRIQGQAFVRQHMPQLAQSFLTTLMQLNERGIVHRDIKPENIMREGTELRLIDWGTMYKIRKTKPGDSPNPQALPNSFLGTPSYVHPKLQQGVGTQNDLHAWGITMLEMLSPNVVARVVGKLGERKMANYAVTLPEIKKALESIRDGTKITQEIRDQAREALEGLDDPNSMFNLARQCLEAADTSRPGYSAVEWMNRAYSRGEYERLLSHPALKAGGMQPNVGARA
jgi:hypothetical protein